MCPQGCPLCAGGCCSHTWHSPWLLLLKHCAPHQWWCCTSPRGRRGYHYPQRHRHAARVCSGPCMFLSGCLTCSTFAGQPVALQCCTHHFFCLSAVLPQAHLWHPPRCLYLVLCAPQILGPSDPHYGHLRCCCVCLAPDFLRQRRWRPRVGCSHAPLITSCLAHWGALFLR